MNLKLKERVVIEFLAKEGCAPKEIHNRLKNVHHLAPSDFYLFGPLKDNLRGFRFNNLNDVKTALKSWVTKQNPEFFQNGFDAWDKRQCVQIDGDYVEQ